MKKIVIQEVSSINNISELCDVYDLCLIVPLREEDLFKLRNHMLELYPTSDDLHMLVKHSSSSLISTRHFSFRYPKVRNSLFGIQNIPFFRNLQTLIIEYNRFLTQIKGLEDIPTVKLRCLHNLSDISGLGRNRYVELVKFDQVKDVSSLANVCIVRIEVCEGIEDYRVLSKVPRLKIVEYWTTLPLYIPKY